MSIVTWGYGSAGEEVHFDFGQIEIEVQEDPTYIEVVEDPIVLYTDDESIEMFVDEETTIVVNDPVFEIEVYKDCDNG